jgi:ech hydrogenase subunit D
MDKTTFLARVEEYHEAGWRLALINATTIMPGAGEGLEQGAFDVAWAFARGAEFETIRERVAPSEEIPSISGSFAAGFLYENEMRELFGINVTGLRLDLKGQMYKTATRIPFAPSAIRARLEALGRAEPAARHGAAAASAPAEKTA